MREPFFRRFRSRNFGVSMFAFGVTCALALKGFAQEPKDSTKAPEKELLQREGKKLLAEGRTAEACEKFEARRAVDPSANAIVELAACREKQGKLATAFTVWMDAAEAAEREKRRDIVNHAKLRARLLETKFPRISIVLAPKTDTEGLEIQLDGVAIPDALLDKPMPIDAGDHMVVVAAPGKKTWQSAVPIRAGERKTVSVPVLTDAPRPTAEASPVSPAAAPPEKAAVKEDEPADAEEDRGPHAGRLVVEVSAMAGIVHADIQGGTVAGVDQLTYSFQSASGGDIIASCGSSECTATFDPMASLFVGGQAFVGYAVHERVHVGGRFFGGPRVSNGWILAGGPSASLRLLGPVWLGATFLLGNMEQDARLSEIAGAIPAEFAEYNGGDTIPIAPAATMPKDVRVSLGFAFGVSGELSVAVMDWRTGPSWLSGSLMISAWPAYLHGSDGSGIAIPLGVGYRFY